MIRPLKALNASLLMLARRLRRFLRLTLEKPFTLSLIPPPRRVGGLRRLLALVSLKESVDRDPPTEEERRQPLHVSCLEKAYLSRLLFLRPDMRGR
jgi:hypothetical protein